MNIKQQIITKINKKYKVELSLNIFTQPPKSDLGDLALPCFEIAKVLKKNPVEVAKGLIEDFADFKFIEKVEVQGPYVNFWFTDEFFIKVVGSTYNIEPTSIEKRETSGIGESKKKIILEFAHPNTHKAFHIGHLRNLITGESLSRILKEVGHEVIKANYQGDVGLHIAKALWGIDQLKDEYEKVKKENLNEKVNFLGKAYALGGTNFEDKDDVKKAVYELNKKIYNKDEQIKEVYQETRKWSLDYFDHIYKRLGSGFDRFYFESEVFAEGKKIVLDFVEKGVFEESDGAVIYDGEKHDLHKRVFINSEGFPTYEAKEVALAKLQLKEFESDKIIHLVGKEQSEYFKVVFKALEEVFPKIKGKEQHLAYGWVSLKKGKMSSRTGQVVLGEWLIEEIKRKVLDIMKENNLDNKEEINEKVAVAAVKYAMLKIGLTVDMKFDIEESISLSGNSGPYLLYIVARVNSILEKVKSYKVCKVSAKGGSAYGRESLEKLKLTKGDKALIKKVIEFEDKVKLAAENLDPSFVAKYLFDLAQEFNSFYHECSVIKSKGDLKNLRILLLKEVKFIMKKGLDLLGIETVEKM